MGVSRLLLVAATAAGLATSAPAQNAADLPSAPSANLPQPARQQEQPAPQPQAQSPRQSSAPAAPVIESLDPPKPRPQSQPQPEPQTAQQTNPPAPAKDDNSQEPTLHTRGKQDESIPVYKSAVNEVNVVFTVIDKHNHYVKDLKESDFKVLDDRKPPLNIRNFAAESNLPLRVGLLIDASNSIRDRFRFEQQAAIEFLNQIINPKRDEAFVLGFDTTPEITQDFTGNTEKLGNGVRMLRPGGGTALYDAVYGACRDKLLKARAEGGLRRAIILLSDGEDNQSRVTRDDAIEEAQRAEVIVYTISTNVSGTKSRGDKILEAIAEQTGGRAFFPFKIEEVSDAFSQIQEELRSQYAISYTPSDFVADGKYRTIDIESINKKYRVRSRKGYFAPKTESASAGK